ncbi:MAG: general secretion pathway protein G [Bradymonadia bacterium]|jgi:general secretion pathway protein G
MEPQIESRRQLAGVLANQRGMTLVEIMIVLTIMASIMGVVGVFAAGALDNSRAREADIESAQIAGFVEQFYVYVGDYPDSLNQLVNPPSGVSKFTSEIPDDPWGNPYQYSQSRGEFSVCSFGKDESSGGEADHCAGTAE